MFGFVGAFRLDANVIGLILYNCMRYTKKFITVKCYRAHMEDDIEPAKLKRMIIIYWVAQVLIGLSFPAVYILLGGDVMFGLVVWAIWCLTWLFLAPYQMKKAFGGK